ncbi:MAG TPA: bifunctional diguanylate cyclase/phosphodiesterase [Solirubrobacteraceae bacterium]|jgi:diguanylate cyclase (GGDEF)-like protein|nr:bifunctional diguanylate cyclase/phosphodiesterase [Solirubrobacteraceae bacterium]
MSLTRQVALLSLIPIVALGLILARVLQSQIDARVLADATQAARLIATIGIQPRLSPAGLRHGLTPAEIKTLDHQLGTSEARRDLARIKIWNAGHTVVYSDDHRLIGRTLVPSDDLHDALAGHPHEAAVVEPRPNSETAGEVGLGRLVEVYVPLRFTARGRPAGAFEIYLSYSPIATAVRGDKRMIALLVAIGLALLWAIIYRIVARASRRLRRQAQENHRLARFDPLTRLPNRTMFLERVTAALEGTRTGPAAVAVMIIDLDRFGEMNNTLGSGYGDRILCEVAARLRRDLGEGNVIARLGADEYGVLAAAESAHGATEALALAARVQGCLQEPIEIDDASLNVEASIGVAVGETGARDPDELLRRADAALARAGTSARRIHLFAPETDSVDPEQLILLGEVRGAIEREEFVLLYQPKVDLSTRRVSGVEALLRWRHPRRGLLSPNEFVATVEQTALIGPLTLYVVDHALRQVVAWRREGVSLGMSVNLSARNLLDRQLPQRIGDLLRQHDVPAQMLTVEVTESAAMADPDRAVAVLQSLREMGVRISVDDFGTGNASIEYLAALPAHELKIDRSFITGMLEDERLDSIVRATIDLARNLELSVVAEGIETAAVLEHVAALGCDVAQGYAIARPSEPREVARLLGETFGGDGGPREAARGRGAAADRARRDRPLARARAGAGNRGS